MATYRGHGGVVTVLNTNTELGVGKWTCDETAVLANKTNSKSLGHKQRQATVNDTTITLSMPWDSDADPAAIGIRRGATVKVVLNKGESGKKLTSNSFIIEKNTWENDEDEGLVMLTISGYSNENMTHS